MLMKKPKGRLVKIDGKFYQIIEEENYDHYNRMKAVLEIYDQEYAKMNNEYMMKPTPEKARELIEYEKREFVDPIDNSPAHDIWLTEFEDFYPLDFNESKKSSLKRHSFSRKSQNKVTKGDDWSYDLLTSDPHRYLVVFMPSVNSSVGLRFGATLEQLYEKMGHENNKKAKFIGFVVGADDRGGLSQWYVYQKRFSPHVKFDLFEDEGQVEDILSQRVFKGSTLDSMSGPGVKTRSYESSGLVTVYFLDKQSKKMGRLVINEQTQNDYLRLERVYQEFVK
jgi:hypothetical protein